MKLEDIVLSEVSQPQKDIYCVSPGSWSSQPHREKVEGVCPGLGGERELVCGGTELRWAGRKGSVGGWW